MTDIHVQHNTRRFRWRFLTSHRAFEIAAGGCQHVHRPSSQDTCYVIACFLSFQFYFWLLFFVSSRSALFYHRCRCLFFPDSCMLTFLLSLFFSIYRGKRRRLFSIFCLFSVLARKSHLNVAGDQGGGMRRSRATV